MKSHIEVINEREAARKSQESKPAVSSGNGNMVFWLVGAMLSMIPALLSLMVR